MNESKTNILNNFFTKNTFYHCYEDGQDKIYDQVISRYIEQTSGKNNLQLVSEVYSILKKYYRNEYFYKNTLLNKLLLGVHSVNTTIALTEVPIANSKADFVLINLMEKLKEWYDGYRFGDADIYCPWDVIHHVEVLCKDAKVEPKCYWINSSGNSLVKRFISKANKTTRDEIERLIAGEPIEKSVRLELTYDEIDNSIDNIWSVLFTTGYLTQAGMTEQGSYKLVIPNKEVREVYKLQIQDWFDKKLRDNTEQLTAFWNSIEEGKLLRYVISLFKNRNVNKKGAQLLFTSHDMTTMKNTVFRRDEIWFAAENERHESEIYSLYEIRRENNERVNSTAAYDKQYLEGRYGADPYLTHSISK